jgi:glycerol-3-phosphate acyltransferase PlsY
MKVIFLIILSYLIGCFSSAYLIGKVFKKIDIRTYGSGNAGATNAVRVMGKKLGVLTFLLDFFKGFIAVFIGYWILGYNGGLIAAICVVVGHDFPIFLGFKGGKGIATTIGVMAVLNFPAALVSVIIGLIVGVVSRYVSLGSIVFLIINPVMNAIIIKEFNPNLLLTTIVLALVGLFRHKSNIQRLINGNENKIGKR